jgi:predicted ATP-grasp superfamily ATP-dependent carboligase
MISYHEKSEKTLELALMGIKTRQITSLTPA